MWNGRRVGLALVLALIACSSSSEQPGFSETEAPTAGQGGQAAGTAGRGGSSGRGGETGEGGQPSAGTSAGDGGAGESAGMAGMSGVGGAAGGMSGSSGQGGASQGGMGGTSAAGAGGNAGSGGAAQDPVLFVHGYAVPGSWWDPAVEFFKKNGGYPPGWVREVEFSNNFGSIIDQAKELATEVDKVRAELGVEKVDIISHSMGGLTARWYLAFEGGHLKVRDYVSFSGAHHGTGTACATLGDGAMQMCPAYSDKDTTVQWMLNGDPDLADVDETPFGVEDGGQVHWNVFWSDGDLIILPNESACLNQKKKDDCSDPVNTLFKGVLHSQMNTHEGMLSEALLRVNMHNAANP